MEKLFYTIGEAAQIVGVKPYVLRYWEGEFRKLNPQKSETGQRTYRTKDLQTALAIKNLLYGEKYTIAGAVKKLEEMESSGFPPLNIDQLVPPAVAEGNSGGVIVEGEDTEVPDRAFPKEMAGEFLEILKVSKNILARNGLGDLRQ